MKKQKDKRQFILEYYHKISGSKKTEASLLEFISDPSLIQHILFLEKIFPEYEIHADEITVEGDRVVVKGRKIGKHTGHIDTILPSNKMIEIPFATCYRLEKKKIIDYWFVTDQMTILEQLGLIQFVEEK